MHPLIDGLMRPEAYDHPVTKLELLQTHISWVILTGELAYKLKKPVDLGFVDFTTLERRRDFCYEEIRLNRRLAEALYLAVRPIYGTPENPSFVPSGEPIEYAVQMRQFDQKWLLPAVLKRGELRPDHIDRLAVTIADFHYAAATAEANSPYGTPEAVREPVMMNFRHLEKSAGPPERIAALKAWSEAEFEKRQDWFAQRRAGGAIRECHGDMHLGNMVLLNDTIEIFDCLEFNPKLRWTDVIAEIAFLVMDLQDRGRPDLGLRVLNGWLEHFGDYAGLAGWRWYTVYRALVRAKVAALRLAQPELSPSEQEAKQQELATYLDLAQGWTQPRPTAVLIMHGVSGSGKSYVAQRLCERLGAVRIRADVERKRLFGRWGAGATARLTGDMYSPETTVHVYRNVLGSVVPAVVEGGFPVVVDATCLKHWQRRLFQDLAAGLGVRYTIVDVRAKPETLRNRLRTRQAAGSDPSDADLDVMERQLQNREPLSDEELSSAIVVDTESSTWEDNLYRDAASRIGAG